MQFTCLSRGSGFHFPPCYILSVSGYRILLDCPLDLSALTIFSPVPGDFCPVLIEEHSETLLSDNSDVELETRKRCKMEKPLDAKNLIHAEPCCKTVKNLHFWDPSSIDIVLISSTMGMLGLPFLTRSKGFSAKIYATEAATRLGQLIMEDIIAMHIEFRQFYGPAESDPRWLKWEELELLHPKLKEVALGKDSSELGAWIPLYSLLDVKDCVEKIEVLKYAEAACYNGALVIKAFSSGLEIGSCNWSIQGPKGKIACISSSLFSSTHAMEFDYHSLCGNDMILYSDFSFQDVIEEVQRDERDCISVNPNLLALSGNGDNWKVLNDCLLSADEILEESDKLAFICSCVVDSVKAGGNVLIPLSRLGVTFQLLEQISTTLESSALKVPIFVISSVAAELLAFTNVIPEWLCKARQEKLFSGEPLFSHAELIKEKKLNVFPDVHSSNLITNWQEPCIIFASHWNLRLGPIVPLLRRWNKDPNSLLVLEDGLDADMALLPFKPIAMKVLQCSFLTGIRMQKTQSLLKILQPKVVALPEYWRQNINGSSASGHSFPVFYYTENETQEIPCLKDLSDLELAIDGAAGFRWRKLKWGDMNVARLEGELLIDNGKHRIVSGEYVGGSSQHRHLLHWGMLDMEKLVHALSNMGMDVSIKQAMNDAESDCVGIIKINGPDEAQIEVRAMGTSINASSDKLATTIFKTISTLLDSI